MKILGIVSEYNPFHNGHKFHIDVSKELTMSDYVVCVMSGNFIQRGEPALADKWARTEMALYNGADLVIELPVSYVLQSAEKFAYGAVKILDSLGIVDYISFGSESGNIDALKHITQILYNEPYCISNEIKKLQKQGYSFPKAYESAIIKYLNNNINNGQLLDLSSPNNILGIEYVKAIMKLQSSIIPITIKRHKSDYNSYELKDEYASATAIRNKLKYTNNLHEINNFVPHKTIQILNREINNGKAPIFTHAYDNSVISLLRRLSAEEIACFPDVSEGLENRISKMSKNAATIDELISLIKTKRYTQTRLRRIIFNILIGNTRNMLNKYNMFGGPQYIRVLGTNEKGRTLLRIASSKSTLPIITKTASYKKTCNPLLKEMFELDIRETDLYSLGYPNREQRIGNLDYLNSPITL